MAMALGGKRPGAGRKTNASKLIEAGFVASWFTHEFQEIKWKSLVQSEDENISLGAMKYLTDRLYGKAKERIEQSGKITLAMLVSGDVDDET